MENTQNMLLLDNDRIVKEGVSVFEVTDMPAYNVPYVSPHYIISVCKSGSLNVEYDASPAVFVPHDLAIIYPQHTLIAYSATPDYHATLIAVSAELYAKMGGLNFSNKRFACEQLPHFHLTNSQYDDIMVFADTLHRITLYGLKSREDTLVSCIYILSQIIDHFHDIFFGSSADSIKWLSHRFYNAIIKNCHQHRDVKFYADLFCLSPKHFSSVVKQQTGHTAGYWIQHYLVIRMKQTLGYEPAATVQSVRCGSLRFPRPGLLLPLFQARTRPFSYGISAVAIENRRKGREPLRQQVPFPTACQRHVSLVAPHQRNEVERCVWFLIKAKIIKTFFLIFLSSF